MTTITLLRMTTLDGCVREIVYEQAEPPRPMYQLPLAPGLEGVMGTAMLPQNHVLPKMRSYRSTGQTYHGGDLFHSYRIHVYIEVLE